MDEQEEGEESSFDLLAQLLEDELGHDDDLSASASSFIAHQDVCGEESVSKCETKEIPERMIHAESSSLSSGQGSFNRLPMELHQNILKFLSSEDLLTCARVCHFLTLAASDESLWRRLYCLRWGLSSERDQGKKPRGSAWKQLYFERDKADMLDCVKDVPLEFRKYYLQMQAAKRSQVPIPSQVLYDLAVVDTTITEQISAWRHSHGLSDFFAGKHLCSGRTCTYYQIGDAFLCERTGQVHVCDHTCRETVLDPSNDLLVCTISGRCFDRWISPSEEPAEGGELEEPFLGSCRLARAYSIGYDCDDERELAAALREVLYPGSNKWMHSKRRKICY